MNMRKKRIYKKFKFRDLVILILISGSALIIYSFTELNAFVNAWGVLFTSLSVTFLIYEIKQNKEINEAELIIRINSEFINNPELVKVEHKFEQYFYQYKLIENKKIVEEEFDVKVDIGSKKKMKKKELKRWKKTKNIKKYQI